MIAKSEHVSGDDLAAMVRAASKRAWDSSQAVIDGLVTKGGGDMQAAEDVLAVAALAEVLRYRLELCTRDTPGMAAALVRLHRYVGEVIATAEKIKEREREVAAP